MQEFPKINETQVVLLRADSKTGHVLDENYNLRTSDEQIIYSIFDSLEKAKEYINVAQMKRNDIEFVIYSKDQSVVKFM